MLKIRLLLAVLTASSLAFAFAGCGDGESSSDLNPASVAPPGSVVYVEGTLRPTGALKSNVDSASETIAGVGNLGDLIVSELETAARDGGESLDFEEDVDPWLGSTGAVVFQRLEDDELSDPIILVQSTDTEATQRFIDEQKPGDSGESAVGIVDDFLVIAANRRTLESVANAAEGNSLGDEARFEQTIALASGGSLADAYVDVGGLLDQGEVDIDDQVAKGLDEASIDPDTATAVVSLTPGADQIEIDIRSDELSDSEAKGGFAPELLGSLPGRSFAGLAFSGFGEQLQESIDSIDAEGIPGVFPAGELKSGLQSAGIDLEAISGSLEDAGVFAVGGSEASLEGALVLTTKGTSAADSVASLESLLRLAGEPGVKPLGGRVSGFSVRTPELGPKPLVVAAGKGRIAIGYGLAATLNGLASGSGATLSDNPAYDDAVASLGGIPIVGFADGPASLRLADSLIPPSDEDFESVKRFLRKIRFLALGSGAGVDPATAKLIVGLKG